MFPHLNTKDPRAVAEAVRSVFLELFPNASPTLIDRLFADVEDMFSGRYLDYQAIDIGYHDFEHTLQATLCFALIFRGRARAGTEPKLPMRDFEVGLAAVLLHDSGYLKLRSDSSGSSAKYTQVHVMRSSAFAASYVPSIGFDAVEAEAVANAIQCTGAASSPSHLFFSSATHRVLGCMLVTADYLGQMAAADYCDELETLYREFDESDDFYHKPKASRFFQSAQDLIDKTPAFWTKVVLPKLENEFEAQYRFLAQPYPDGPNAYLDAIEANISKLKRRPALVG